MNLTLSRDRLKRILSRFRFEVRHVHQDIGRNPYRDIRNRIIKDRQLTLFDVGANLGQTVGHFRKYFNNPIIHCFEPSPTTFNELKKNLKNKDNLFLNNLALGPTRTEMDFIENTASDMSSMLEPGVDNWSKVKSRIPVRVETIDGYCAERGIYSIDVIKSDTQGFDLEVLKGASHLLNQNKVHLIFMEIIFSDMYKGLPRLDEIYAFLSDHGFSLVSFYKIYYQRDRGGWTDALFINPNYQPPKLKSKPEEPVEVPVNESFLTDCDRTNEF
jgi:FkbM family methyltransferase